MNAASFGTWEMKAGNPAAFAFRLAFMPDPDGAEDRADDDHAFHGEISRSGRAAKTSVPTSSRARKSRPRTGTCFR